MIEYAFEYLNFNELLNRASFIKAKLQTNTNLQKSQTIELGWTQQYYEPSCILMRMIFRIITSKDDTSQILNFNL